MPFKMTPHISPATTCFFIILLILTSCNQNKKQVTSTNKSKVSPKAFNRLESKIIDTIFSLKEVKERQKYIEEQTKGKRHLQIWIADKPNMTNKYYWIKVGEDNGINLVTHFNFNVYPDSMSIMYFDTQNDKEITLKEWRKINVM